MKHNCGNSLLSVLLMHVQQCMPYTSSNLGVASAPAHQTRWFLLLLICPAHKEVPRYSEGKGLSALKAVRIFSYSSTGRETIPSGFTYSG